VEQRGSSQLKVKGKTEEKKERLKDHFHPCVAWLLSNVQKKPLSASFYQREKWVGGGGDLRADRKKGLSVVTRW